MTAFMFVNLFLGECIIGAVELRSAWAESGSDGLRTSIICLNGLCYGSARQVAGLDPLLIQYRALWASSDLYTSRISIALQLMISMSTYQIYVKTCKHSTSGVQQLCISYALAPT